MFTAKNIGIIALIVIAVIIVTQKVSMVSRLMTTVGNLVPTI